MGIYLGLDLSTTATGVAYILEDGSVKTFSLYPAKSTGLDERIEFIRRELSISLDALEKAHGAINLVCIEAVPFMNRPGSSQLNDLNGVIRNMILRRGIVYRLVNVATWKKFILGSGRPADKKESLNFCKLNGFPAATDNESDAVCIMLWGKNGGPQDFRERQGAKK